MEKKALKRSKEEENYPNWGARFPGGEEEKNGFHEQLKSMVKKKCPAGVGGE